MFFIYNLDQRGQGDIWLMTVQEYKDASMWTKFQYRVYRNPLVLFIVGPPFYFWIRRRFPIQLTPSMKKEKRNLYLTNIGLFALYGGLTVWLGLMPVLTVMLPITATGSGIGVWLFYVQHNFPGSYWKREKDWNQTEAGTQGSSYYDLSGWLNWFAADIAVHHIHHVNAKIPNYKLRRCMNENQDLLIPKYSVSFRKSLNLTSLKLLDETRQVYTGFPK
jgi:omega-6 fatty acid desaturase (delta-12 desaturase)